ncbi:MAG: GNAT family N-acetyltransferase [Nocardioides sp.]|nr:GNAT family N-acetyltransferase [Nocardioides sp.]
MSSSELVRTTPASLAEVEDLCSLFGTRGAAARCQCQRYRLAPGEAFADLPIEDRRHRLVEQAGCGDSGASTSGLVAWIGGVPVGWCAVGPRSDLDGLVRTFTVPWKDRTEDRTDPRVWAVTCVLTRVGHRRRGIASSLIHAAVPHARSAGARSIEGYPITTNDVINEELHVGTARMFADAGFRQVSAPTRRRVVMRIDL